MVLQKDKLIPALYRVPDILTFQVAANRTTNKLQTKKNDMNTIWIF